MKNSVAGLLIAALFAACTADMSRRTPPSAKMDYPKTRQVDQVDDYHGTKVADPYRWLEDDNAAETRAWVEAQNKVTFGYLEQIPQREAIRSG